MNVKTQKACAWSGPLFVVLFLLGFGGLAGFIPPPSPAAPAAAIAEIYRNNGPAIRAGLILTSLCSALLLPYFAVISVHLKRIEGSWSPLAYLQMIAGALACIEFIFPVMIWQAAAFRSDRSAEEIQLLNDLAWLPFLGIVSTAIVQGVAIGVAILQDPNDDPAFPRWAGYFNIWVIMLLAPGGFIVFFKTGPLAWNGVTAWWLVLAAYLTWISVNTALLLRAINHQEEGAAAGSSTIDSMADELAWLRRELDRLATRIDA